MIPNRVYTYPLGVKCTRCSRVEQWLLNTVPTKTDDICDIHTKESYVFTYKMRPTKYTELRNNVQCV